MRPVRGRQDEKSKVCQGECDTQGSTQQPLLMTGTFSFYHLFGCEQWNKHLEKVLLGVKKRKNTRGGKLDTQDKHRKEMRRRDSFVVIV